MPPSPSPLSPPPPPPKAPYYQTYETVVLTFLGDGASSLAAAGEEGSRERAEWTSGLLAAVATDLGISEQRLSIDKDAEQRDIVRINPPNEVTTHTHPTASLLAAQLLTADPTPLPLRTPTRYAPNLPPPPTPLWSR